MLYDQAAAKTFEARGGVAEGIHLPFHNAIFHFASSAAGFFPDLHRATLRGFRFSVISESATGGFRSGAAEAIAIAAGASWKAFRLRVSAILRLQVQQPSELSWRAIFLSSHRQISP